MHDGGKLRLRRSGARAAMVAAAAALTAAFVTGAAPAAPAVQTANASELSRSYTLPYRLQAPADTTMEASMLTFLNQSRKEAGLSPVRVNPTLRIVARRQGAEMFAYGYLSHQSKDGRLPLARVEGAGLSPWHVGENLAYAGDVPEAHRLLMNSPEHRENILSPLYRWVGIAVMNGGPHGVIVVEDFTD